MQERRAHGFVGHALYFNIDYHDVCLLHSEVGKPESVALVFPRQRSLHVLTR